MRVILASSGEIHFMSYSVHSTCGIILASSGEIKTRLAHLSFTSKALFSVFSFMGSFFVKLSCFFTMFGKTASLGAPNDKITILPLYFLFL